MSTDDRGDSLRRTAVGAATAGAVVGVPADLYHLTIDSRTEAAGSTAFALHGLGLLTAFTLLLVALAALLAAQRGSRTGTAGGWLALFGTTFVIGDLAKEAFALPVAPEQLSDPQGGYLAVVVASFAALSLGWLLTAVALRRDRVLPTGPAWLLGVGAVLAFPPLPGAYVLLLVGAAAAVRVAAPVPARPARVPAQHLA